MQGYLFSFPQAFRYHLNYFSFRSEALMMGFLRTTAGNAFSSLSTTFCRPQTKYQERSWMERELEELNGFFNIFPE
jgi:hypothetical protein